MKWLAVSLCMFIAVAVIWVTGPRETVPAVARIDPATLAPDLDDLADWLAVEEAAIADLRPGADRRVVWGVRRGQRTPLAIVYLHGFSATAEEVRPVPDRVAENLRANLYLARLTGHGRSGEALGEATAADWIRDTAEAIAIGRRLGRRVLVIGTSLGGALATLAAADPSVAGDIDGLVLISPSYRIQDPNADVLALPWARYWLPLAAGPTRGFEPVNEAHGAHWTAAYPTVALLPMAAVVNAARAVDVRSGTPPALFLIADTDRVVDPAETRRIAEAWGGRNHLVALELGEDDDPRGHVIAGRILSPGQTDRVVSEIVDWARYLEID